MQTNIQNLTKFIVILCTLWVLVFGLFQFGMSMDMSKPIVNCPFSSHSMSICKMNPLEHIQEWQNMFTTLPTKSALPLLFMILASVALSVLRFGSRFSISEPTLAFSYVPKVTTSRIFSPLKAAYSQGILNPKVF